VLKVLKVLKVLEVPKAPELLLSTNAPEHLVHPSTRAPTTQ